MAVTCRSLNRNEMQTTGVRKSADVKQLFEERRRATRTRVDILSKNRKLISAIGETGQQGAACELKAVRKKKHRRLNCERINVEL